MSSIPDSSPSYDYVIVGAGSAGCLLANRLSSEPQVRVLLLEAGGNDNWFWIHVPAGTRETIGNPRTDWCYQTETEPVFGRRVPVARGRVLGGSSSVNGTVYQRGTAADYDHWRQLGLTCWGWDDVLPYFKRHENFIGGADEVHGGSGELRVEHPRIRLRAFDVFTQAAIQAGIPHRADFNRGEVEGCGMWDVKQDRGRRVSAATAFLDPVIRRPNLDLLMNTTCAGLTLTGSRVTGVEVLADGERRRFVANREVIMCAGAIGTPQILQLSGIGPGDVLRKVGVTVKHERRAVGANLQDHVSMRFAHRVHGVRTVNTLYHNPVTRLLMGLQYLLARSGPLVMGAPLWGGYARSDPARSEPNLQFLMMPVSMSTSFTAPDKFDAVSGGVYNLRPQSRGWVRIQDPNPTNAPAILHNYLAEPDDRRVAVDSLRLMRRIFATPAFQSLRPEEFRPGPEAQTDEELLEAGIKTAGTAYHQVGTCAMGRPESAVVDERLRAFGLQGLRIADGSVMPAIVSGSTGTAIMMIAEKAAQMIREDARSGAGSRAAA